MKKVLIRLLFLIAIVSFIYVVMLNDYGIKYNIERTKRGIPMIPKHWITDRNYKCSSQRWFPSQESVKGLKSYHDLKQVKCNNTMIESEVDSFVLEGGKFMLFMLYDYNHKKTPWHITYYQFEGKSQKKTLSYDEAIKVLQKHEIQLSPNNAKQ
jgi:hypothetical protein